MICVCLLLCMLSGFCLAFCPLIKLEMLPIGIWSNFLKDARMNLKHFFFVLSGLPWTFRTSPTSKWTWVTSKTRVQWLQRRSQSHRSKRLWSDGHWRKFWSSLSFSNYHKFFPPFLLLRNARLIVLANLPSNRLSRRVQTRLTRMMGWK